MLLLIQVPKVCVFETIKGLEVYAFVISPFIVLLQFCFL